MAEQIIEQESEESVCKNCNNEQNDKTECALTCKRREAYALGRPYKHIPYQITEEVEMEQKEEAAIDAPINEVAAMKKPVKKQTVEEEEVEITLEVRQVKKTRKCLICGREESDKVKLRRGLCVSICHKKWHDGKLLHPKIGKWRKMTNKELNEARHGEYEKCRIVGCEEVGNRRGLCEAGGHYKSWSKKRILHPELGEFFPKRKTKTKMKVVEKSLKQEKSEHEAAKYGISDESLRNVEQDLFAAVKRLKGMYNPQALHTVKEILDETAARIITIDLVKYDALYNKLQAVAKSQLMPIEHTIISLISCGMQFVERNTKQNFGDE